jgi:hydroxyacylglutathione hydrolase
MLITRSEDPHWRSNAYVVAEGEGGRALWIDGNGRHDDLHRFVEEHGLTVEGVLITHHHADHVEGLREVMERYAVDAGASPEAIALIDEEGALGAPVAYAIEPGVFDLAGMRVEALPTPGHAAGHLSFLIDGSDVFTGDVLFAGTTGGTRAPGHTTLADLRRSVMDVLLALPDDVVVHPGHSQPTTIGTERVGNVVVRYWRGEEPSLDESVTALGEPATLLVWAPDYDGGNKALVRWADGSEDIVGASRVERS